MEPKKYPFTVTIVAEHLSLYGVGSGDTIALAFSKACEYAAQRCAELLADERERTAKLAQEEEKDEDRGGTPIEENPSYRNSLKDAGRGHLLK